MYEKISPIINSVINISEKSKERIVSIAKCTNYKKGDTITSVGQKNNQEYFILDGICKSFLKTPNGEDITISLFMSKSILSPSTTRNKNGKSVINIQALTDVEMVTIDAVEFEQLMIEDIDIREFGNSVLRNELMAKVEKKWL